MINQNPKRLEHFAWPGWDHDASWTYACATSMDELWLQRSIDRLGVDVGQMPRTRGGNDVPPLADLAKGTVSLLGGRMSGPLKDLLGFCVESDYPLPSTRQKIGGNREPCGPTVVAHNLSPEWVRHFLGAFHDRKQFEKALGGRKFFPYENRDHLVHTLICSFIGEVSLGLPLAGRLKAALSAMQPQPPAHEPATLFEGLVQAYSNLHPTWFSNPKYETIPEVWIKNAWMAISLWHDAGYDTATWYLLTSREFQHCQAVENIKPALQQSFAAILSKLRTEIGHILPNSLVHAMAQAEAELAAGKRLYEVLWHIEGCENQDSRNRKWGRLHALLSAYEFLNFIDPAERQREDVKHIAAAIAEHHEQVNLSADTLDWNALWTNFCRNPLAALLAFADYLAGFERVKVAEPSPFIVADIALGAGRMSFDMDINSAPLWIIDAPDTGPHFFRGRRNKRRLPDRFSLWAVIDKAEDTPPSTPSALKQDHCTIGGCKNVAR